MNDEAVDGGAHLSDGDDVIALGEACSPATKIQVDKIRHQKLVKAKADEKEKAIQEKKAKAEAKSILQEKK